jgi:hypothetical protein
MQVVEEGSSNKHTEGMPMSFHPSHSDAVVHHTSTTH